MWLAAAALVVGLAGWLASAGDGPATDVVDRRVSTTTATTVRVVRPQPTTGPTVAPGLYAALGGALPASLDGLREKTGAPGTGPLDLDAAVAAEPDESAERSLLETRGFRAGYGRSFTDGERTVYVAVYEFETAAGAAAYLEDGFVTLTGEGAAVYDVASVPGGRGFSQVAATADGSVAVHGVAFTKGTRFALVFVRSRSSSATAGEAASLAADQHART